MTALQTKRALVIFEAMAAQASRQLLLYAAVSHASPLAASNFFRIIACIRGMWAVDLWRLIFLNPSGIQKHANEE